MNSCSIAKVLRKKSTWAEKKLWAILRDRRFAGYKFRRQYMLRFSEQSAPSSRPSPPLRAGEKVSEGQMRGYILDFYCSEARYNLELDGSQHGFPEQQAKDATRDDYLKSRNIQTRRFWNSQLKDVRWVRETIWADLQARAPHPGNVEPEKPMRLSTRMNKLNDHPAAHPSPRPSPR